MMVVTVTHPPPSWRTASLHWSTVTTTGTGSTGQGPSAVAPTAEPLEEPVVPVVPPVAADRPVVVVVPDEVDVLEEHATAVPMTATSARRGSRARGDRSMGRG